MPELTFAIVSDLHVGKTARSRDLCPHNDATHFLDEHYRERFLEFLRRNALTANYLLLPGDISESAAPAEVQLASEVVLEIADALRIPQEAILFVPGNHDVDWSFLSKNDPTGLYRQQRYVALRHPDWVFDRVMRGGTPHVLDSPHFCIWERPDLLAVGYNSSWHDGPNDNVHHGLISQSHLEQLGERLNGVDMGPDRVRLFLVHHHPLAYSQPLPDTADFSIMVNSENLLTLLRQHHFDVLVHGHQHCPKMKTHIENSGSPIVVLCAGSFSGTLDNRWINVVGNQFHLLTVSGRDPESGNIRGMVRSWAYNVQRGWMESNEYHGIQHVMPFGTYLQHAVVKRNVRPIVEQHLQNRGFTKWSMLVSELPDLRHLPREAVSGVLTELAPELHFELLENRDDFVLLRE